MLSGPKGDMQILNVIWSWRYSHGLCLVVREGLQKCSGCLHVVYMRLWDEHAARYTSVLARSHGKVERDKTKTQM